MRRTHSAGFTLIELLVTIAVLAVIVAVAIPSFRSTINGNRLTSAANEMAALMQTARSEAIRSNRVVVICPSATPEAAARACASDTTQINASTGLVAYFGGAGGANIRSVSLPPNVVMRGSATFTGTGAAATSRRIVFRPDGFARSTSSAMLNTILAVCIPTQSPNENIRYVSLASGSRVTTQSAGGNGACTATIPDVLPTL